MYIYPIAYSNGFYAVNKDFGGFDECLLKTIYYDYSKIYTLEIYIRFRERDVFPASERSCCALAGSLS